MFFTSRETKCILFIVSFLCLNLFSLRMGPLSSAQNLLILSYCLSEWKSFSNSFTILRRNRIFGIVVFMIIPSIVLVIYSPHYHDIKGFFAIIINEIIIKYLMLWIGFTILTDRDNYGRIYRCTYYALIILTIFGLINFINQSAPWISWLGNENYDASADIANERFRVKALFSNSFNYGFACLLSLIFFYVGYSKKYVNKKTWFIVIIMCVFGIIAHGSRTNIVTTFIFVFLAVYAQKTGVNSIKYILGVLVSICLLYTFVPVINERINLLIETLDPNNNISGSSLDMRDMQLNSVLYYIRNNLLFGCGYRFFYFDMGWGQFYSGGAIDNDLRGMEGVHLEYLLERGLFGYISYLFFYLCLIIALIRSQGDRLVKIMALSVVCVYLAFSHMTGELGTAPIALFFTGLLYCMSIMNQSSNIIQPHRIANN